MNKQVELKIYGKRFETKNAKWIKYSFVDKNKKYYDVKFVEKIPNANAYGYLKVVIEKSNISIKKNNGRKNEEGYELNDVIFLKGFINIEKDVEREEEVKRLREKEIDDLIESENLPF